MKSNAGLVKIEKRIDRNGTGKEKLVTYDKFKVADISYNDSREIVNLTVVNQHGRAVYHFDRMDMAYQSDNSKNIGNQNPKKGQEMTPDKIQEMNKELVRTGVALDAVLQRYGIKSIEEMDGAIYRKAMNSLKKTKSKAA